MAGGDCFCGRRKPRIATWRQRRREIAATICIDSPYDKDCRAALVIVFWKLMSAKEHRKKASLLLHSQNVGSNDGASLAPLASGFGNDLKVRIVDHRSVNFIHVCWRHIINAFIEVTDQDRVAIFGNKTWDVFRQLVSSTRTTRHIEEVKSALFSWIVRQHVQTRTAKMGLRAAVEVEDVVVLLPGPIGVCKVNKPVASALRIVDRKRTYKWSAIAKRVEYGSFR